MPLVQLRVTNALNGSSFDLPAYGNYDIVIISAQYHSTDAGNVRRVIQIQSDQLRFVNSPLQYLTFLNNYQSSFNWNNGFVYSIKNVSLNGKIRLFVVDADTNLAPANFTDLILTLDIQEKC